MLSEDIDQLACDCPPEYQEELTALESEEIEDHRYCARCAAEEVTTRCSSSIEQIKSKPFFEQLECHDNTREDLLGFFVQWTQDDTWPRNVNEFIGMAEKMIVDFETDTDANFAAFLNSYFPREEKRHIEHSLILVALLNGENGDDGSIESADSIGIRDRITDIFG